MSIIQNLRYQRAQLKTIRRGRKLSLRNTTKPMNDPIDFVVTWVDSSDPVWRNEKERYQQASAFFQSSDNGEERYRNWDLFRYWFRAVEKYAPWVNNVYLVTWGHVPSWLDLDSPKLKVIKHTDFIPSQYLPTFSSNPIELNLHRIAGLSEHFIYFNDDMFLNRPVKPEDFFSGGMPKYTAIAFPLQNNVNGAFNHMRFTVVGAINSKYQSILSRVVEEHCDKWFAQAYGDQIVHNRYVHEHSYLLGMFFSHLPTAFRKSTFTKVWEEFFDLLDTTCSNRFRTPKDAIHQIFSLYEIVTGAFYPVTVEHHGKLFGNLSKQIEEISDAITHKKYTAICINDTENVTYEDYLHLKKLISDAMQLCFPDKSSFEK